MKFRLAWCATRINVFYVGTAWRTCDEIQGLGILDFAFRGSRMQVMPAFNKDLAQTDCVAAGNAVPSVLPARSRSSTTSIRYGKPLQIPISAW